jgi:DNA polymerase
MTTLHIDLETRSVVDLRKAGVYVYAEHEHTDVWCAAYAIEDDSIELWVPGQPLPRAVEAAVEENWDVVAHNANFERVLWAGVLMPRYGWPLPKLSQWRCTMSMALAMALPGSLENCAAALALGVGKDMDGHNAMMRMAKPRRPRKGEDPTQLYWFGDDERKEKLYAYCMNDVEVERAIAKKLLPLRSWEQKLWHLDQTINDRGVHVDLSLCQGAQRIVETATEWLNDELDKITGGEVSRVSNVGSMSAWLRENGCEMESLDKAHVEDALIRTDIAPDVRRVLEIRREGALGANAKIDALVAGRNADGRARGLLQYHQAGTGRWAGRRFQPQNLPRGSGADPDGLVEYLRTGDAERVDFLCGKPLRAVSDCLRSLICAAPGNKLMVADFSNIEGRIIAWLSGEEWKLQAFRDFDAGTGSDLYKLAYARAFRIKPDDVSKDQRQIGKVMELALGYQGGVGAFQKMAAVYGVEVDDTRADVLKNLWREAHPNVVQHWWDMQGAAMDAIRVPGNKRTVGRITFVMNGSFLFMRLPSGRAISYPFADIREKAVPWGGTRPQVSYMGTDTYTRKWCRQFAHGGLLFNNAVQGIARDIEAEAIVRSEAAGYHNVLNVHDEVVAEVPVDFGSVSEYEKLMTTRPAWASYLPVAAAAWSGGRYRK